MKLTTVALLLLLLLTTASLAFTTFIAANCIVQSMLWAVGHWLSVISPNQFIWVAAVSSSNRRSSHERGKPISMWKTPMTINNPDHDMIPRLYLMQRVQNIDRLIRCSLLYNYSHNNYLVNPIIRLLSFCIAINSTTYNYTQLTKHEAHTNYCCGMANHFQLGFD